MPIYRLKNTGNWRKLAEVYRLKSTGNWRKLNRIYRLKSDGTWRRVFSSLGLDAPTIEDPVEILKSADYHNASNPVTLTGIKYHFANATTFEYRFYSSSDQNNWNPLNANWVTTSNPASGSSSNVTYVLSNSDFTSTTMYFQFRYRATNSSNVTTVSLSTPVSVMLLDIPVPPPGFPFIDQSTISVQSIASSGLWENSPTQYSWIWQYGPSNNTLTYEATKSISSITLSGTTALVSCSGHGFKDGDAVTILGATDLFNIFGATIGGVLTNSFAYDVSKSVWQYSTNYSANSFVSYNGQIYKALLSTPTRTAWSFTTNYTTNQYVDYGSPSPTLYRALANTPSPRSNWSSSTTYTAGQYVNYSGNVWQSTGTSTNQTPVSGSDFWTLIDIYPGGSGGFWTQVDISPTSTTYWQVQNNTVVSTGSAKGPNYYEGVSSSQVSYTIPSFPATDYKTGTSLQGLTTRMRVTASNAGFSNSANSSPRIIYGYPVINIGTISVTPTTASIPYTQTNLDVYDINIRRSITLSSAIVSGSNIVYTTSSPHQFSSSGIVTISGFSTTQFNIIDAFIVSSTSNTFTVSNTTGATGSASGSGTALGTLTGYPKINQTNSSPISISSLPSNSSYTVYLSPKNADSPRVFGVEKTSTFSTPPSTGLTPIFGNNTSTSNGFTGSITNYDALYNWNISTTAGSVSWGTPSGSTYPFTVSGLNPGQSATVTVTTSREGYDNASATTTGSALQGAALNPIFGTNTSVSGGFNGSVTNYDSNWTWFLSTSAGTVTPEIFSGTGTTKTFSVSGLSAGQSATVTVTTQRNGYASGSGSTTGSAIALGLTPTFGTTTRTSNGFTGSVNNYNASWTWLISTSAGSVSWGTPSGSNYPFVVFGLNPGQSATITVTTVRTGYQNGTGTITQSALQGTALTPVFGTNTSVSGGFNGSVTNYDSNWTWFLSTSAGTVTPEIFSGTGTTKTFSVSGLSAGQSATVTVTTQRTGYNSGSNTTTGTAALGAALNPTFGAVTRTNGGFTSFVNNYNSSWSWSISTTAGSVSWGTPSGSSYPFTVSGLTAGQTATVTVTTTRSGFNSGSGSVSGTALSPGLVPTFGSNVGTSNGFTGFVNNYDLTYSWSISVNSGSVSWGTPSGSNYPFTVTGLSAGASATVTVTTSRAGNLNGTGSTTGTASPAQQAPGQVIGGSATRYTNTGCNKTDISWSAPTSGGTVASYEIYVTTSSTFTPTSSTAANLVSGIAPGNLGYTRESYSLLAYYFVRARNAAGAGPYSARITPTLNTSPLC